MGREHEMGRLDASGSTLSTLGAAVALAFGLRVIFRLLYLWGSGLSFLGGS